VATETLAEGLAVQFQSDAAASPEAMQRSCERLSEHPAILAASLWDQDADSLASAGITPALIALTRPRKSADSFSIHPVNPPPSLTSHVPPLQCVEVALGSHFQDRRPARMCLLIAPDKLLPQPGGHVWGFYAPILGLSLGALLIGLRSWRQSVIEPLAELATLTATEAGVTALPAVCQRGDEWGRLARNVLDLRSDLGAWREHAQRVERQVDHHVATATQQIARHLKRLERKSCQDPLTGLANRRLLNERLPTMFAAQQAAGGDLAAIMLDVDHFKALNDSLGHTAGDEILSFVGELLAATARGDDLAVRYGGDEFLLILPGVNVTSALAIAERLIAMFVQRVKMMGPHFANVSLTAGIATLIQHRPSAPRELIVMADRALYDGKRAGKKGARVCGWGLAAV
jgi:diguanylate cyclase (GGDEF)-like protein